MAKIIIIPSTGESLLIHSVTGYVTSLDWSIYSVSSYADLLLY